MTVPDSTDSTDARIGYRRQSLINAYDSAVALSRFLVAAQPVTHGSEIHCHVVKVIGELGRQVDEMKAFDRLIDNRKATT